MMLIFLFALVSDVIKDDFLVDQETAQGNQVQAVVAVAANGNFAVAWEDSLNAPTSFEYPSNVYIRFFDKNGNPITDAVEVSKDTVANSPRISVDASGHFMCIWGEWESVFPFGGRQLYGQVFDNTGTPLTDRFYIDETGKRYYYDVDGYPDGFFVAWVTGDRILGQRYDTDGNLLNSKILVHTIDNIHKPHTRVDVNRNGVAVVAWEYMRHTGDRYIKFQIVNEDDSTVVDSVGMVTDNLELGALHGIPSVRWVNDDEFIIFWLKHGSGTVDLTEGIQCKKFNATGDSVSSITTILDDSDDSTGIFGFSPSKPLSVSSYNKGLFAIGYAQHHNTPDSTILFYRHSAGFIANGSMEKVSDTFRLASSTPHEYQFEWAPEVDANDDIVVWVWEDNSQGRINPEGPDLVPYFYDIHCKITEWGVAAIAEHIPIAHPNWQIASSVGRQIVLRYSNSPQGFHAAIFNAAGQKVDEVHSDGSQGTIVWGKGYGAGVYFIKPEAGNSQTIKVILIR